MHFGFKEIFGLFNVFLLPIAAVSEYCETENSNSEINEICFKLRPLKYSHLKSAGCEEFCQNIICETIKNCTGVILRNESYCNCCDACIKYLDIDQPCKNVIRGSLALGSQSRCKPGTKCKNGKCQLDQNFDNSCLLQREHRNKLKGKGEYAESIWIPQCHKDGTYKGKQNKISKSVCVDEQGIRIFGSPDDSNEHTCACSRHMQKKKEEDIAYNVKSQEHCSASGNFDTLQCIDNLCYCADEITGQVNGSLVRFDFLDKLPCYDSAKHKKNYMQNCEKELQRSRKLSYELQLKGVKLLGTDLKCDPDGSYSPTQCQTNMCVCTNKDGVGINSYQIEKRESMKINMTCNCARDEISSKLRSPLTCLGYGNYNHFTCFDNECVCVDEDGDSISIELNKSDADVDLLCKQLLQGLSQNSEDHEPDEVTTEDQNPDTDDTDNYYDDDD